MITDDKIIGWINRDKIAKTVVSNDKVFGDLWDDQVKWASLLTLAGYKESNEISLNGGNIFNPKELDEFGSFILNDSRAAPMNFTLKTKYLVKHNLHKKTLSPSQTYDSVLSFSGGIDSTAGLLLELEKNIKTLPVWVGFGQKNESDELKVINHISSKIGIEVKKIHLNFKDYVDNGWSRWKLGIIPARNYLFASIAANILDRSTKNSGGRILICAHKEEITPINTDKSQRFFETSSRIFSKFYQKKILVETPFRWYTKPEIVSIWHRKWEKKYNIKPQDTVSCYYGNNCGVCKACINRAIAFTCANVDTENFLVNPFKDKDSIIKNSYLGRFEVLEKERKLDFLYALKNNYKITPTYIKQFVDENFDKYKKDIENRIIFISNSDLL